MHIQRATRDDIPSIATVASRAMMEDELSLWLSPEQRQHKHLHRERCLRTTRRRWQSGMILLIAVTDESDHDWDGISKVVGYAAYEKEVGAPDDSSKISSTWTAALERLLHGLEESYIWYFRNNLGTIRSRSNELVREMAGNDALSKFERYWELDFLAVDPAFGRRGIGAALIDCGQQRAAEDEVPLLLWASRPGYPLYIRKGFKVCGLFDFGGMVRAPVMVWKPEHTQEMPQPVPLQSAE